MFNIWTQDVYEALDLFKEKFPNKHLIGCIEGNYWGDIIIRTERENYTYKVKEKALYAFVGTWQKGQWQKI